MMGRTSVLSPRELEVLLLTSFGYSSTEAADRLSISAATVRTHRTNILTKMRVHNMTHAVGEAFRTGVLKVEDLKREHLLGQHIEHPHPDCEYCQQAAARR